MAPAPCLNCLRLERQVADLERLVAELRAQVEHLTGLHLIEFPRDNNPLETQALPLRKRTRHALAVRGL